MAELIPLALKDAPALIEVVYPALKVSFEAQKERKANLGQTLTGLGSYWKGRKPLILVRSIVLGSLLPPTERVEKDLEIYEQLMAFDREGLAKRALMQNAVKPHEIAARINLLNPWDYFSHGIEEADDWFHQVNSLTFPLDCAEEGIAIRWRRDLDAEDKLPIYRKLIDSYATYEEKAGLCKRPEELDQDWLYAGIWPGVNRHYARLGIDAHSHQELVEQLGILRFGHRPRVGDTFCGGGSIPFESARLGCDVYASDLNPIACMLTWGALNIIGASPERRAEIEQAQRNVAAAVDEEITALGIEHDENGNRAKAFLYCLETRCPDTGWLVPLSPSWVISKTRNIVAQLIPNQKHKRFDIQVNTGVTNAEMKIAEKGTIQEGNLVYELHGREHRYPIKTLRGDYRDTDGINKNRLRRWEKSDFKPRPDDIFQERLYAIQWITKETLDKTRKETFFTAVRDADLDREGKIEEIVAEHLATWQERGLVPDMAIEPGDETTRLFRERGWTHWHHLFNSRQLLLHALYGQRSSSAELQFSRAKALDWNSRICHWIIDWEKTAAVFYSQALNTFYNYGCRAYFADLNARLATGKDSQIKDLSYKLMCKNSDSNNIFSDYWITDPPYADAVNYHEITEFFIAWLRKNPPAPFDQWIWDSRRALAIKGTGDEFRRGMVDAYKAMADHMPDNGLQCVMFTHQDTGVWADMVGIFWAAGLQVVAAWYIATETTSELKKGGYVQGTVILMLSKRHPGDRPGFKQRILPLVNREVENQITQMMNLNTETEQKMGEPVFNKADLQIAGNAAALKVLTNFTHIGGEDVTRFAMKPRRKGEVSVVDEIVLQAAESANNLLVPEGLATDTWRNIQGIQRFYLRMLDIESSGATKLDNYQNFAKAFRVANYGQVMASVTANKARLKAIHEFRSRELSGSTEIGGTDLGLLLIALQELLKGKPPEVVVRMLHDEKPDLIDPDAPIRRRMTDMAQFLARHTKKEEAKAAAELLAARIKNLKLA